VSACARLSSGFALIKCLIALLTVGAWWFNEASKMWMLRVGVGMETDEDRSGALLMSLDLTAWFVGLGFKEACRRLAMVMLEGNARFGGCPWLETCMTHIPVSPTPQSWVAASYGHGNV
jgi:hypothetical protein